MDASIKVTGAKELRRAAKKVAGPETTKALKKIHKKVAKVVADQAETEVPARTGRLQRSVTAVGTASKAVVKAGTRGKAREYAAVTHYGNPHRGIEEQPFVTDAVSQKWPEARKTYETEIEKVGDLLRTTRGGT